MTIGLSDLESFLAQGVSLALVTRDDRMVVELVRCAAAVLEAGRVKVAIPLPEGARSLSNVELTGAVALTGALPSSYRTVQVKGAHARRCEWPEMDHEVELHRTRWIANLEGAGLAAPAAGRAWSSTCAAIEFTPSELLDLTPGPAAVSELAT